MYPAERHWGQTAGSYCLFLVEQRWWQCTAVDCLGVAAADAAALWAEAVTPVLVALWLAGEPGDPVLHNQGLPHSSHGTCHLGYIPQGQMVALHLVNLNKKVHTNQ
jgi:hypothetical protein